MQPLVWILYMCWLAAAAEDCQECQGDAPENKSGVSMLVTKRKRELASAATSMDDLKTDATKREALLVNKSGEVVVKWFGDAACTEEAAHGGSHKSIFHKVEGSTCAVWEYFRLGDEGSGFKYLQVNGLNEMKMYNAEGCTGPAIYTFPSSWLESVKCPEKVCMQDGELYKIVSGTGFDPNSDNPPQCSHFDGQSEKGAAAVTVDWFGDEECTVEAANMESHKTIFHKVQGSDCVVFEYFRLGDPGSGFKYVKIDENEDLQMYNTEGCEGPVIYTFASSWLETLQCPEKSCVKSEELYYFASGTGFFPNSDDPPSCFPDPAKPVLELPGAVA